MNDIAIYFERIDLGDDKYVFKPINIIRGYYDKKENLFETDYGIVCEPLNSCEESCTTFFPILQQWKS